MYLHQWLFPGLFWAQCCPREESSGKGRLIFHRPHTHLMDTLLRGGPDWCPLWKSEDAEWKGMDTRESRELWSQLGRKKRVGVERGTSLTYSCWPGHVAVSVIFFPPPLNRPGKRHDARWRSRVSRNHGLTQWKTGKALRNHVSESPHLTDEETEAQAQ